jgi:hypothetical protein
VSAHPHTLLTHTLTLHTHTLTPYSLTPSHLFPLLAHGFHRRAAPRAFVQPYAHAPLLCINKLHPCAALCACRLLMHQYVSARRGVAGWEVQGVGFRV